MSYYDKVLERISQLIHSEQPEKELKNLAKFQMELEPHMSEADAINCVILGFIRTYQDYTLDFLWLEHIKEIGSSSHEEAA